MNDDELDLLVASTAPISQRRVAQLPLSGPEDDLLEAIMSTTPTTGALTAEAPRLHPRRWLVAVAAAIVLIVGLATVQQLQGGRSTAWAAEVVAIAEAAPRLLVDRPGWAVARADQFAASQGEMTFSNGRQELDLRWIPVGEHGAKLVDRADESDLQAAATVVGRAATVFRYTGTSDYVALWEHGEHSAEARGVFPSISELNDVLGSLVEVDVDTWLSAMPASVVKPSARDEVVDQMLADLPLPDGFDRTALRQGASVQDRYQLGAKVAGSVACRWIERWIGALTAGDAQSAQQAVDAMATSRRWAILIEMDADGAYPKALWELADAMTTGNQVSGGKRMTVQDSYANTLGCATR